MPLDSPGPHDAALRWSAAVVGSRPARRRALPRHAAGDVEVPYTILAGREEIGADTYWAEHSHPTHELLWNERGASTARIGSRVHTISPGVGLWIPAGVPHSGWTPSGTWHRAAHFSVREVAPLSDRPVAVEITPLLRLLLGRLGEELTPDSRSKAESMVLDVLAPAEHEFLLRFPESDLLRPIIDTLREDPADTTTLAAWATRLGVSSRTLTRAFHAETGMGFAQWSATARAQHAIVMLAQGEGIEEVAERVGFRSASSFSTAFRRVTGMSPGRFRSQ